MTKYRVAVSFLMCSMMSSRSRVFSKLDEEELAIKLERAHNMLMTAPKTVAAYQF
jgi:hypothetical protein